jgi:large conductance mechanosensitive channel
MVKGINKIRDIGKKEEAPVEKAPTTKVCPFCKSEINIEATRCPNCTSEIEVKAE